LSPIPLVVVIVYLVGVTALGSLLAKRANTSSGWTVAGGGLGLPMLAAGVAGTRIGGAGTYGVAGNVASGGVWYLWWYSVATFLALALVGLFFAKPYRRLGLQTVGEIFWERDRSRRSQVLTSLCVQTEYFVVNVIEAYIIGAVLSSLTGMPMLVTLGIAAFILVSYTTLGGLWGAAVTNLVHSGMILVGLLAVGVLGVRQAGGWDGMTAAIDLRLAAAQVDAAAWWSPTGAGWMPIVAMVLSAAIHTPAASIYTNFSTAARSERLLLPGFLAAGSLAALMPLLAGVVGMLTLARYGFERGLSGYANITSLATEIDPWVGGLALAAVLAAVISSGGPVLLSSATMFVRDWLPRMREAPEAARLRAYRVTTIVYGIVAALVAWLVSRTDVSLLDLLLLGYAMVVPPAIAVGYLVYWKRTTEASVFWGMALGFAAGVVAYSWIQITGTGPDPSYATTLVPLVTVPLIALMGEPPPPQTAAFYSRVAGTTAGLAKDPLSPRRGRGLG